MRFFDEMKKKTGEITTEISKKTGEFSAEVSKKKEEMAAPENVFGRAKVTESNKKAWKEFIKKKEQYSFLTEEQEAILYSQVYELPRLKNPSAAKFPEFDEFEVEKIKDGYCVKGYVDGTNSYGAQVREKFQFELMKQDGIWVVTKDGSGAALLKLLLIFLLIMLPGIIAWIYIKSLV